MLKFSEILEFSKEKFRKIPILKEFEWFEWFEWFGPSPTEPFNSGVAAAKARARGPASRTQGLASAKKPAGSRARILAAELGFDSISDSSSAPSSISLP